jgi:hypothetical protein
MNEMITEEQQERHNRWKKYSEENESLLKTRTAENTTADLVIIPSGYALGKPPVDENISDKQKALFEQQINKECKIRLFGTAHKNISLTVPKDENIYHGGYSYLGWKNELTHSPQEKAKMIYEAITATDENGNYKYHNIYFSGGSNTEDVVKELKKLEEKYGKLPDRRKDLKTFGFSDAQQMHNYLGQNGISSPYYYSKNERELIKDIAESNIKTESCELTACNDSAKSLTKEQLTGILLPADHIYKVKPVKYKKNIFVIDCMNNKKFFDEILNGIDQLNQAGGYKENIIILLSKDNAKIADKIKNGEINCPYPVFSGIEVGHGSFCQSNGKATPLFKEARIENSETGNTLIKFNYTPVNYEFGNAIQFQQPEKETKNKTLTHAGNAGPLSTFEESLNERVTDNLTISFKADNLHEAIQNMEMSVKNLVHRKIIDTDLQTLSFKHDFDGPIPDKTTNEDIKNRLEYLQKTYLPNTKIDWGNDKINATVNDNKEKVNPILLSLTKGQTI